MKTFLVSFKHSVFGFRFMLFDRESFFHKIVRISLEMIVTVKQELKDLTMVYKKKGFGVAV